MSAFDEVIDKLTEAGLKTSQAQELVWDAQAAHRAQVLYEAADLIDNTDTCRCGGCDTCIPRALAARIRALATPTTTPHVKDTTMTNQPTVTVTAQQVEAALRGWLASFDGDVHYSLAEPEDGGPDQYPTEAQTLFLNLRTASQAAGGITPPAPADQAEGATVYELRTGALDDPRPDVIARYATTGAAAAHGEALYRAKHGAADNLEWPSTGDDNAPTWRLQAVDDLDGDETLTDWHITQVTIPAEYAPAGGAA